MNKSKNILLVTGMDPGFKWYPVSEELPFQNTMDYFFTNKKSPLDFLKNIVALNKLQKKSDIVVVQGIVLEILFLCFFSFTWRKKTSTKWILVEMGLEKKLKIFKKIILQAYLLNFNVVQTFSNELKSYLETLSPNSVRIYVVPCMYSYSNYAKLDVEKLPKKTKEEILSVGRTGRDFEYFISEVKGLTVPVKIIGKADSKNQSENISSLHEIPYADLLDLIKGTKLLVISLKESDFPLGIRLIFLGMQYGCYVLFTNISGNYEYFSNHKYIDEITFSNKPGELLKKISALNEGNTDQVIAYNLQYLEKHFSPKRYIFDFNNILRSENFFT